MASTGAPQTALLYFSSTMSRFWIEFLKGERAGDVADFDGDVVSVGRTSSDSTLKFDERGVSWEHAEFRLRDDAWWLIDLGSTNGTYVNEDRAQNAKLNDGDVVRFGKKGPKLRFRLEDPATRPLLLRQKWLARVRAVEIATCARRNEPAALAP